MYALAIKVPLGTWVLVAMAAGSTALRRKLGEDAEDRLKAGLPAGWRDQFIVLAPAVVILVFVSSQTGFSEHMRYVLPIFSFVYVWVGARLGFVFERAWWSATGEAPSPSAPLPPRGEGSNSSLTRPRPGSHSSLTRLPGSHSSLALPEETAVAKRVRWQLTPDFILRSKMTTYGRRAVTAVAGAALAWSIGSSLWVYPHSLSYFNELVGGPLGGPEHLIHSNVDWGQDLLFLKDWLKDHPEATAPAGPARLAEPTRPINLVYFGYFDPKYTGIEYAVDEALVVRRERPITVEEIPPGWYAVSVNFVRGYPWFVYKPDGTKAGLSQGALTAFQQLKPVARAGYSIYIYRVERLETRD